jgi:GNAT superfamily N-acetyltransferase
MTRVEYLIFDETALESVRPLWIQLNAYHHRNSRFFQNHYDKMTYDDRKIHFQNLARGGQLRIEMARDPEQDRFIGYCISSLSAEKHGEFESVFIEELYRGQNIGSTLIRNALVWMKTFGVSRIRVSVADGNSPAMDFYRKFDFVPRMVVLELPK